MKLKRHFVCTDILGLGSWQESVPPKENASKKIMSFRGRDTRLTAFKSEPISRLMKLLQNCFGFLMNTIRRQCRFKGIADKRRSLVGFNQAFMKQPRHGAKTAWFGF
jgi:hypothetical protein